MRTTLNIDGDVMRAARTLAREQGRSLGDVISELARRGLRPQLPDRREGDFPVFDVAPDAGPITPEMIQDALEELPDT